jgi:hypothetical protein
MDKTEPIAERTDIIGTAVLDDGRLRQLDGFIKTYHPRIIEPAKEGTLGWVWKAEISTRVITVITLTDRISSPLVFHGLHVYDDIDAILLIRPRACRLIPIGHHEEMSEMQDRAAFALMFLGEAPRAHGTNPKSTFSRDMRRLAQLGYAETYDDAGKPAWRITDAGRLVLDEIPAELRAVFAQTEDVGR